MGLNVSRRNSYQVVMSECVKTKVTKLQLSVDNVSGDIILSH